MSLSVNVCFLLWNHTLSQCLLDIRKFIECILKTYDKQNFVTNLYHSLVVYCLVTNVIWCSIVV